LFGLTQTLGLIGRREPLLVFGPPGTKKLFTALFAAKEMRSAFPIEIKDVKSGVVLKEELFDVRAFPVKHNTPAVGYALIEHPHRKFDEAKARAAGIRGRLFTQISEKGSVKLDNGKTVKLESVTFMQEGKKLVFSGDTTPCAALAREAKKADLLVHDSCFATAHEAMAKDKAHSTARQAAEIAKKNGVKKLLLTHFSNRYDEDRSALLKEAREVFAASELAEEGMELLV
jgi:ribonuclease Z